MRSSRPTATRDRPSRKRPGPGSWACRPTPALPRATRPDQQVVYAAVADLPARLAEARLPGPVLVMLGATIGDLAIRADGPAQRAAV